MGKMSFGALTLSRDPNEVTPIIGKKKSYALQETYSGVSYYDWGCFYAGNKHTIKWDGLPATEYDQIQTLIDARAALVWTPTTSAKAFNVQLLEITGEYIHSFGTTFFGGTAYRKNVELLLVILSEV